MSEGVVVSVTDRGDGISRDVVAKAFNEPFTAGEDILRKERAGAGMGLHMARQLVLQHGGIMWADPLPAGGTRMSFVIPAHQGETVTKPPSLGEVEQPEAGGVAEPGSLAHPAAGPESTDEDNVVQFTHRTGTTSS
jgi:hypothetical protein